MAQRGAPSVEKIHDLIAQSVNPVIANAFA